MFESQILNSFCLLFSFVLGWVFRMAYVRSRGRLSFEEKELIEKEIEDLLVYAKTIDEKALSLFNTQGVGLFDIRLTRLRYESNRLKNEAKKKLANMRLYGSG